MRQPSGTLAPFFNFGPTDMPYRGEIRIDLKDGIDRKSLARLRERFLRLNTARLARAEATLLPRQQRLLRLLPLLLHVNHPLLPGYLSGSVPAGLSGYQPSAEALAEARRLSRAFVLRTPSEAPPEPILALFLMGSPGSIAHNERSDLDLWVCHAGDLAPAELDGLREKCRLIEAWAEEMGAELHLYLIDTPRFASNTQESEPNLDGCAARQHYLLLEEFYRSAIWLGGRLPLWWFVPAEQETDYPHLCQVLLERRFLLEHEVIDLGYLPGIPPQEYLGAALWQLSKGIESPYKSLLKLLLLEQQASQPDTELLALQFKRAVHAAEPEVDAVDPYLALLRQVEAYLLQGAQHERLALVRRAFYLKAARGQPDGQGGRRQPPLLDRLCHEWGWSEAQRATLDGRQRWRASDVKQERRALVRELSGAYRLLLEQARRRELGNNLRPRDLALLGRRLYAAYERKAGKVEWINPGIVASLAETHLTLVRQPASTPGGEGVWALYAETLSVHEWPEQQPLQRARQLIELLVWGLRNGVIVEGSRITLHAADSELSEFELHNLLARLRQHFPQPQPVADEAALLAPCRPLQVLLLVNVALDPLPVHSQLNVHLLSERNDALDYSGLRENLAQSLDRVVLDSWGQLLVQRYDGPDALLDCLCDTLNALPVDAPPAPVAVACYCRNRAPAISERIEQLVGDLLAVRLRGASARYLLQISQHYHLIELQPGQLRHQPCGELDGLLQTLAREHTHFRALHLDRHALQGNDLRLILPMGSKDVIRVFYRVLEDEDQAELSLLDERNALWRWRLPFRDEASLLIPLQRFLQSLLFRRGTLQAPDGEAGVEIRYYRLQPQPGRGLRVERLPAPQQSSDQRYYEVQAILEPGTGLQQVTLYCDQCEFSALDHGNGLFREVARHILAQRRDAERYPCYITDLDLSALFDERTPQTVRYLRYKAQLEAALNEALARL